MYEHQNTEEYDRLSKATGHPSQLIFIRVCHHTFTDSWAFLLCFLVFKVITPWIWARYSGDIRRACTPVYKPKTTVTTWTPFEKQTKWTPITVPVGWQLWHAYVTYVTEGWGKQNVCITECDACHHLSTFVDMHKPSSVQENRHYN